MNQYTDNIFVFLCNCKKKKTTKGSENLIYAITGEVKWANLPENCTRINKVYPVILGKNSKSKTRVVWCCLYVPFWVSQRLGAEPLLVHVVHCMDLLHDPRNHVLAVLGLLHIRLVCENHYSVFLLLFP